ncbi:hypothetical protein BK126_26130 [Paenibacillus sp. FSL H7-0326]|uniref:hypothetical protein n=1 Tax=Paenibacillus sp. FSL H7-0326 TaxID=1921144 RepID=UPI0009701341|nr:hypothetical protein [Paenibacillus sp. FSL H7-0326]OMC63675.1 hypothetical protein BK126_26130 [Paenibacillus sp. FSL H7-0326]
MDWIEAKTKLDSKTYSGFEKMQLKYEEEHTENECTDCGKNNKGIFIFWGDHPTLQHVGLWVDGVCSKCGRSEE